MTRYIPTLELILNENNRQWEICMLLPTSDTIKFHHRLVKHMRWINLALIVGKGIFDFFICLQFFVKLDASVLKSLVCLYFCPASLWTLLKKFVHLHLNFFFHTRVMTWLTLQVHQTIKLLIRFFLWILHQFL